MAVEVWTVIGVTRQFRLSIIVLMLLGPPPVAKAQFASFSGCPPGDLISSSRVDDYWDAAISFTRDDALALRDGHYQYHFRVQNKYWDEGFGWKVFYDERDRPFAKFFSGMHILGSGISTTGSWQYFNPNDRYDWFEGTYDTPSLPDAMLDGQTVSATFRDAAGHANLVQYNPYAWQAGPALESSLDLHDLVDGDIPLVSGRTEFARPGISADFESLIIGLPTAKHPGNGAVVAFAQDSSGDWRGWDITADLPGNARPVVAALVPSPPETVRLIGINPDGRLIWLQWQIGSSAVNFGLINLPDWEFVAIDGSLVVVPGADGRTSILGIDRQSGHLLHVAYTESFGIALAEDVTREAESGGLFSSGQLSSAFVGRSPAKHVWQSDGELTASRIVVDASGDSFKVFLTRDDFHVQAYTLAGGCRGEICARREWTSIDLDRVAFSLSASNIFQPPRDDSDAIEVSQTLVRAPDGLLGIGARATEDSGNLVHIRQVAAASFLYKPLLQFTDVSGLVTGDDRIEEVRLSPVDLPSAHAGPDGTVHAIATNGQGRLVHYFSPSYTRDWNVADVHSDTYGSLTELLNSRLYTTSPGAASLTSEAGDIHVVGFSKDPESMPSTAGRLTHFILRVGRPWHSNFDYYNWADGRQGSFRFESDRDDAPVAWAVNRIRSPDRIKMKCPSFNRAAGPARIASIMLHEATHLHYKTKFDVWDHVIIDGTDMDPWIWHDLGAVALNRLEPNSDHRHSMYQIQVEYLADIAEFGAPWLPFRVRDGARFRANTIIENNIVNPVIIGEDGQPVPFRVGLPRP